MALDALVKAIFRDVAEPETVDAVIAVGGSSGAFATVSVAALEFAAVVVPLIALVTTTR